MSDNTNNSQDEEIELGQFILLIARGIGNFFRGIGNFFKGIFHNIILGLIFLKKNIIILGTATVLGVAIGYYLDNSTSTLYSSEMLVEVNFGSGDVLYKQLDYVNTLIAEKDTKKLSQLFNTTEDKVKSLSSFTIEPYDKDKRLIVEYYDYLPHIDTTFIKEFTITDYAKKISDPNYKKQLIAAYSKNKDFDFLNDGIKNLLKNKHLERLYYLKNEELNTRKRIIENDLRQIDSIRETYKKVALLKAQNSSSNNSNTNIDLRKNIDELNDNQDILLFAENAKLLEKLRDIRIDIAHNNYVISVISNFTRGQEYNSLVNKKWFIYGTAGFLLSLFALLMIQLNRFLNNYQTK